MIDLDAWLPDFQVRTHHSRSAEVGADELWRAAGSLRLSETRTLGRLVRWRLPETPREATFRQLLADYPFCVLEEGERHSVSGLVGRIWTFRTDYPELSGPEEFAAWDTAGTVRVLFANWVREDADGRAVLHDEARVQALDRSARLRLRVLWAAIGHFEGVIGSEAVSGAVARARQGATA